MWRKTKRTQHARQSKFKRERISDRGVDADKEEGDN